MPSTLKLVILYNARRNAYTVCDHNLTPQEAETQIAGWRAKSLVSLVVNQANRHATEDPQECLACRRTVEHASGLKPTPRFERMETEMTAERKKETVPAPEPSSLGRKPWKKKTPVEVVLAQIEKVREDVNEQEERLKLSRRELQKLEEAKKLLESK